MARSGLTFYFFCLVFPNSLMGGNQWFIVAVDDFVSGNVLLDFCHVLKYAFGCI